jgi:hypothetical protein
MLWITDYVLQVNDKKNPYIVDSQQVALNNLDCIRQGDYLTIESKNQVRHFYYVNNLTIVANRELLTKNLSMKHLGKISSLYAIPIINYNFDKYKLKLLSKENLTHLSELCYFEERIEPKFNSDEIFVKYQPIIRKKGFARISKCHYDWQPHLKRESTNVHLEIIHSNYD